MFSGVLWHESVPWWTMRPVSDTDVSSQFHKITFSSVPGQLWNTNASLSVQLICLCSPSTSYLFFFRQKILVTCSQWITNYPPLGEKCKERSFQIAHLWFPSFQGFSLESWIVDKIGGESELLVFSLWGNAFCLFAVINDSHVYWDTPAQNLLATDCVRLSQLAEFGLDII